MQDEFVICKPESPVLFRWAVMAAGGGRWLFPNQRRNVEVERLGFRYQHITMHPYEEERTKTKTACLGGSLRETCA